MMAEKTFKFTLTPEEAEALAIAKDVLREIAEDPDIVDNLDIVGDLYNSYYDIETILEANGIVKNI